MATMDIRNNVVGIDEIVFDDGEDDNYFVAVSLTSELDKKYLKLNNDDHGTMVIKKSSINNLIKALQKAQEIWKED